MAKKISQLTQATQVKSDDVTVIVQDGETKKLPLNMMVTKQDIENKKVAGLAKLDEIEATYENDTYTPTIAVKNKSSVKVGEGDGVDYSANVMDGPAKSAILSGQTLVNVLNELKTDNFIEVINGYTYKRLTSDWRGWNSVPVGSSMLIENKQYIIKTSHSISFTTDETTIEIGSNNTIFTSKSNTFKFKISNIDDNTIINLMILEYQDGMENWDIPYFEGMQSVKMPVLKTTGKNLIDIKKAERRESTKCSLINNGDGSITLVGDGDGSGEGILTTSCHAYLEEGKTYTFSFESDGEYSNINGSDTVEAFLLKDGSASIKVIRITGFTTTFICPKDGDYYVRFDVNKNDTTHNFWNIQLEEGSTATSYEPYKSNILTVNEDVTLRGVGDAHDTLDSITGEVTQRFNEIILDGSQIVKSWWSTSSTVGVLVNIPDMKNEAKICCDNLPVVSIREINTSTYDTEGIASWNVGNTVNFRIMKDKLQSEDNNGVREFLKTNPITIQYEYITETIKTVDLMPSGTHPSTTPYCWKNGHIQLSGSGLLPNLEYSVVTSRAGQINQNATMIVKNDKRIFDLEILLAGGLVNTTYQALTLQNQVETGLSKVSLSSEKEPDYLLYHMIMKLIEEKAYKLDDLAEKVSVFYLYEKLSDEQFETIYAALYPFAEDEYFESDIPGDDEVIEEPIVDESLEEVEDEVVM